MKVVPFKFDDEVVRVIDRDGEPWFVAADVARVLKNGRTDDITRRLDPDEKGAEIVRTLGGDQNMAIISESGLYTVILTSRRPEANRFRKWVTAEVLPSIRKTGSYGVVQVQPDITKMLGDPAALRGILTTYVDRVIKLEGQVDEMRPQVAALDRIAKSEGSLCITDAAKTLQIPPQDLFRWMRAHQWIYRRTGSANDVAYQSRIMSGLLEHKTTTVSRTDGTEKTCTQVRVTPKGLTRLSSELAPKLI